MRINKIPFFLWLTQRRDDLTLNLEEKFVESEELGRSSIKEVPVYLVMLIKYLPISLLLPFMYYPTSKADIFPFAGALFCVFFLGFIYVKFENLLKFFTIVMVSCNAILMFTIKDYVVSLDIGITFFAEIGIIAILLLDIFYFKGYKNWYYLESFQNEVNIKVANKRERRFLFWKKDVGFNVIKKVYIKGYFLRIQDENI